MRPYLYYDPETMDISTTQALDAEPLIVTLSQQLQALLQTRQINNPAMIGIHTGGVWVAQRLHQMLDLSSPLGQLDISFYRDDFTRVGIHPEVKPSQLNFTVDERTLILVDDVLHTGRTIRAALNEIFDFGRPAAIILAVLIDRNERELPIQADVCGCTLPLKRHEHIKLNGPSPLTYHLLTVSES